jgi:tRNA (cytidine/uridine-2'-O-)-methyltransferase
LIELEGNGLDIVLYEPEIPANAGNIGRLCLGTGSTLHLIKPLRFLLSDKALKRAGLDYWQELEPRLHGSLDEIYKDRDPSRVFLCTTKAGRPYWNVDFRSGDVLVFGPESRGLPDSLLEQFPDQCITIPMTAAVRSLNLANSVSIILYEALRQINAQPRLQPQTTTSEEESRQGG